MEKIKEAVSKLRTYVLKNKLKSILIVTAAVFGIYFLSLLINGNQMKIVKPFGKTFAGSQAEVIYGERDGTERETSEILEVESIEMKDDRCIVRVKAKEKGTEKLNLHLVKYRNGEKVAEMYDAVNIRAGVGRLIYNRLYQELYIVLSINIFLLLILFIIFFIDALKNSRYSHKCIFYLAVILVFVLVLGVWCASSIYSIAHRHTTASDVLYTINQNLISFVVASSVPISFIYAATVTVSNIVLMKREGVRPANALGIATGAVMAVGVAVIGILTLDQTKSFALSVVNAIASSLYVFFVAVLISSIFCGIYASRFKPSYDKDYIIILGCRIRPDGTLYPLIRGRVDKAIEFYRTQLKKTGKAAYFVPSGGQGGDEIMPEAQAMKNYLVEQGIPEEMILPETASTTTKENMQFSKKIIDARTENASVIFSTTSYHVFRSGIIASEAGINIDGIGSRTKWYFWPNAFLREAAGLFLNQPKLHLVLMLLMVLLIGIGTVVYSLI